MNNDDLTLSDEQREQLILLFGAAIIELIKTPMPGKPDRNIMSFIRDRDHVAEGNRQRERLANLRKTREIERILLKVACDARNVVLPDYPAKDWYSDGRVRERTLER